MSLGFAFGPLPPVLDVWRRNITKPDHDRCDSASGKPCQEAIWLAERDPPDHRREKRRREEQQDPAPHGAAPAPKASSISASRVGVGRSTAELLKRTHDARIGEWSAQPKHPGPLNETSRDGPAILMLVLGETGTGNRLLVALERLVQVRKANG
jgi:hypothetical protein